MLDTNSFYVRSAWLIQPFGHYTKKHFFFVLSAPYYMHIIHTIHVLSFVISFKLRTNSSSVLFFLFVYYSNASLQFEYMKYFIHLYA